MTFVRANAIGWGLYEELTHDQMNVLDTNAANGVDGAEGGAYAPSADIDIDGLAGKIKTGSVLEWGASNYPKLTSRTLQRWQPLTQVMQVSNLGASPTIFGGEDFHTGSGFWTQSYVDTGSSIRPFIMFEVTDCPDGASLINYGVTLMSTISAGAGLAASPWVGTLLRLPVGSNADIATFPFTPVQLATDTGNRENNGIAEKIQATLGTPEVIDKTPASIANRFRYALQVSGEGGANAQAGVSILAIRVGFTCTEVRP